MDKLTMAHEMALKIAESGVSVDICAGLGWRYADAMQVEADKRKPSGLPDALKPEVDWRIAPVWARWWAFRKESNISLWCMNKPTVTSELLMSNGKSGLAPTFSFTGSCVVERPEMEAERK